MLAKLEHYGIRDMANNWFKYWFNISSINGQVSNQTSVNYGVHQVPVLGPLLFLIYINDLNHAIRFCKVNRFADDTDLLYFNKLVNKINKYINFEKSN